MPIPGQDYDPATIETADVVFDSSGTNVRGYLARPRSAAERGGIVLVPEAVGLVEHVRDVARRLAGRGFDCLAVDIYTREGAPDPTDAQGLLDSMFALPDRQVVQDLEAAAAHLRTLKGSNGRVAAIGFCSGGRQVLLLGCRTAAVDAVVDCWGGFVTRATPDATTTPSRPHAVVDLLGDLQAATLVVIGAEDSNPSPADGEAIRAAHAASTSTADVTVLVFDGAGHAFFGDHRPTYFQPAAAQLWAALVPFLDEHIGTADARSPQVEATVLAAPSLPADALDQARALLGMDVRLEQWNNEATRDTIRHYAWGIGDDNPLYCDAAHAATSRWGAIIAPPTFLFALCDAMIAPGLPDIQWFGAGRHLYFDRPIRRNEEITVAGRYVDAKEVSGARVPRMIIQTGEVDYFDADDKRVGMVRSTAFRVPRQGASGSMSHAPRAAHRYSPAELAEIDAAMLSEQRRGERILYWEDVAIGDVLPGTVRGPLTQIDMTCYYAGAVGTPGYKSTRLRAKYADWARHAPEHLPNGYDPSYFGAAKLPSLGHQDGKVAVSELGMPGPYDNAAQRIGFIASCVTNWMGDDAQMRELAVRVKQPVIFGDTTYTRGRVTGVRRSGDAGYVDLEVWAENQLGDVTASGTAVVELLTRG